MPFFSSAPPTQQIFYVRANDAQTPATPVQVRQPVPDAPKNRYQINQRCIYERRLPGEAYMTAHVQRLQPGIYEDDPNMSKPAPPRANTAKAQDSQQPTSEKPQSKLASQPQEFKRNTAVSRSLKKKASIDTSMRTEFQLAAKPRPASYHPQMTVEDSKRPPTPSSSGAESNATKAPDTVYFLALGFVLHPADSHHHRFKSARIRISIDYADWTDPRIRRPKIIKYAPHLIYGVVSNETLNWTFNLAGSLGISQGPGNASVTPSGTYSESAVLAKMMKIQGSTRTTANGIEDGELLWSLEENPLQKSGLPREFTFVLMIQCPKGEEDNIDFRIEVEPCVRTWYGRYPQFWQNRRRYRPLYKAPLDFHERIGQRFFSSTNSDGTSGLGKPYNFASMEGDMDDQVQLPGNTYTKKEEIAKP